MTELVILSEKEVAEVIYQHQDRIYRYVLSMVNEPAEAEDLTQEALVRAYRNFASLKDPAALTSWLYRVATNVCLDRLRQRARQAPYHSDVDPDTGEVLEEASPSLLELIEQDEMSACVQGYLESLSDPYRAVILLADVHAMTGPEIAAAIGVTLPTVKIRLHRARLKLRAALEDACEFSCDERGVLVCEPRT